jgi:hypothetical protein
MILNRHERAEQRASDCAVIFDFAAYKERRQALAADEAAARRAALELARCEAGEGDWRALMAALVAPFNP